MFVGKVLEEVKTWRSFEREAESWLCRQSTISCCQYWYWVIVLLYIC